MGVGKVVGVSMRRDAPHTVHYLEVSLFPLALLEALMLGMPRTTHLCVRRAHGASCEFEWSVAAGWGRIMVLVTVG